MNNTLTFPVIIIKNNDPAVYYFSFRTLGLISKGGEKFYKSGLLFDSSGNYYKIKGVGNTSSANFWESLKYFQKMERVELNIEFVEKLNIEDLKEILLTQVNNYGKYWEKRDLLPNLSNDIMQIDNFPHLINFIK